MCLSNSGQINSSGPAIMFLFHLDVAAAPHRKKHNHNTVAVSTNVENPSLHYGIVVDCGSSGSRVYVYFWPPHSGNPQELLNVQQMRDNKGEQVVKKIEPGECILSLVPVMLQLKINYLPTLTLHIFVL